MVRKLLGLFALVLLLLASATSTFAAGRTLFIKSAVEGPGNAVTLPLYRGTSHGQNVYYILLDASDGGFAQQYGINTSQKLANAANTQAVQKVSIKSGVIDFPGTVDFTPVHAVAAGPNGFPPALAVPGSVGDASYSPLIQLPSGIVVNAPQIANDSGLHDKIISVDWSAMKATLLETDGFQGGKPVKYLSTDASFDVAAALEGSTYVPRLNQAPTVGDDSTHSSRTSLAAFVNGQTGASNPQRQGLNSALLDGLSPLNILRWNPSQGRYSPLWDVHPAAWTDAAIASGQNLRQTDWGTLQGLVDHGLVTGPGGAPFGAAGFIVNCPIISQS
jgi:hypothetical protein